MSSVHPTAIVEDGASIADDVTVGPFTVIGPEVTLAEGVTVGSHAIVTGRTTVGPRTRISSHVFIGGEPQDLSYKGEDTGVTLGADCVVREHATIHRGTSRGRGVTTLGDRCFLMVGSHVAHDCIVGDHAILTNNALLGGHSQIGEYAILGGASAVQQFTRIGAHCFVGGLVGVAHDIVPYAMTVGHRAVIAGVNVRGLKRRGFDTEAIHAIRAAYRAFFQTSGPRADRIAAVEQEFAGVPAVGAITTFLRVSGDRPLTLLRQTGIGNGDD